MNIVNCTPHPITLLGVDGEMVAEIQPSGIVPRATKTTETVAHVEINGNQIPVIVPKFGGVSNLPEPEEGTMFIVSLIVQQACPERTDLLIVEDVVRDGSVIVGCKAFGAPTPSEEAKVLAENLRMMYDGWAYVAWCGGDNPHNTPHSVSQVVQELMIKHTGKTLY
jgi:hypothetical protein